MGFSGQSPEFVLPTFAKAKVGRPCGPKPPTLDSYTIDVKVDDGSPQFDMKYDGSDIGGDRDDDEVEKSFTVNVRREKSITLSGPATINVDNTTTATINAKIKPSDNTDPISWSVSPSSKASIQQNSGSSIVGDEKIVTATLTITDTSMPENFEVTASINPTANFTVGAIKNAWNWRINGWGKAKIELDFPTTLWIGDSNQVFGLHQDPDFDYDDYQNGTVKKTGASSYSYSWNAAWHINSPNNRIIHDDGVRTNWSFSHGGKTIDGWHGNGRQVHWSGVPNNGTVDHDTFLTVNASYRDGEKKENSYDSDSTIFNKGTWLDTIVHDATHLRVHMVQPIEWNAQPLPIMRCVTNGFPANPQPGDQFTVTITGRNITDTAYTAVVYDWDTKINHKNKTATLIQNQWSGFTVYWCRNGAIYKPNGVAITAIVNSAYTATFQIPNNYTSGQNSFWFHTGNDPQPGNSWERGSSEDIAPTTQTGRPTIPSGYSWTN